jgi:hypothetical protein
VQAPFVLSDGGAILEHFFISKNMKTLNDKNREVSQKFVEKTFDEFLEIIDDIYSKIIDDSINEGYFAGLNLRNDSLKMIGRAERFAEGRMSLEEFTKGVQNYINRREEYLKTIKFSQTELTSEPVKNLLAKAKSQFMTNKIKQILFF